jgi:hypothetical protein
VLGAHLVFGIILGAFYSLPGGTAGVASLLP